MVYDCIISWTLTFLTTHMTFRTHLALTFPFVGQLFTHLIGLSVESVNKTTKLFADINIPLLNFIGCGSACIIVDMIKLKA